MGIDNEIFIKVFDEKNTNIVNFKLKEAIERILFNEVPDDFHKEAVKALAVAIRTKIIRNVKRIDGNACDKHKGADICTCMKGCSLITDLEFLKESLKNKFDNIYDLICSAVYDTDGQIMICGDKPIDAEYHITCGGGTENSEDVLGNRIMYFRKVLCSYCSNSPYWESSVDLPVKEIEDKLNVKMLNDSSTYGPKIEGMINEIERDETGRVRKIKIGGKFFSGIEVKELLGLDSSRFGWDPIVFRFKVRGKGDGLGMCLYGANAMALEGKDYIDILKYYYTNVQIQKIDILSEDKPLEGKLFVIDPGHGGNNLDDETGPTGLREKDVNLYIALKLKEYLEKSGAKVIMTRQDDTEVSLSMRAEIANSIRPNFLISIHQNSFFSPNVSGTQVYYYRGDQEGEKLSNLILDNIVRSLNTVNRGSRCADQFLLRESKVSSIIIEAMHISNPNEEKRLKSEDVKNEIAKSIYRGIMNYYNISM